MNTYTKSDEEARRVKNKRQSIKYAQSVKF